MDLKVIEQKQLVERYLLGRLSPPEAKFFEQVVRKSPELAERMGLPEALRRTMYLLDETGTEWREQDPKLWHRPWVPASLAGALLLALILCLVFWSGKHSAEAAQAKLRLETMNGTLLAPTRTAVMRLHVNRPAEPPAVYGIGSRAAPTYAELRLDMTYERASLFKVVIKRDDGAYWARLDNQIKDSNGDLRVAFNSAAFAAGVYDLSIEAVDLRGNGIAVGHVRIRVDAGGA